MLPKTKISYEFQHALLCVKNQNYITRIFMFDLCLTYFIDFTLNSFIYYSFVFKNLSKLYHIFLETAYSCFYSNIIKKEILFFCFKYIYSLKPIRPVNKNPFLPTSFHTIAIKLFFSNIPNSVACFNTCE